MNKKFASIEFSKNKIKKSSKDQIQDNVKIVFDTILYSAIAYIFSCIWFDLLLKSVVLDFSLTYAWFPKLIVTIVILLIVNWPKIFGLGFLGLGVLTALSGLIFSKAIGTPVFGFLKTHFLGIFNSIKWAFNLDPTIEVMPQHFPMYVALFSLLVAMFLIYIKPAPIILTIAWIFPFAVIVQMVQADVSIPTLFAGLFCILITFARQSSSSYSWRKIWQIPPVALIAVVLVIIFSLQSILPQDLFYNEKISRKLDQMIKSSKKMPDTVKYFEFSIKDAGFYPQDVRLGGPINLTDEPFMNVAGPANPFYLRGTIFEHFEQNYWHASSMKTNFMFYNEDPIDQQAEAFAYPKSSKLPPGVIANYFSEDSIKILPIYQPIQAVFHGGKPLEIVNHESTLNPETNEQEIVYYFNNFGQIYASAQIPSSGYSVNGHITRLGSTANYLTLLQNDVNVGNLTFSEQTIANNKSYRNYLETMEPQLAQIVYREHSEQNQKANQLIEIINYLKSNFTYDLNVEEVPTNQDFFEFFISSKIGYCTYFATALTILAREAGFETRYVEGFVVQGIKDHSLPQNNYDRVVSTDQAHAWTEIKIEGLGWVPFDATPSAALDSIQTDQSKEDELRAEIPEQTETEPTEPPTTQTTQPTKTETSPSEKPNPEPDNKTVIGKTLLIILGILALIALIILYILWRRKVYANRHNPQALYDKFDGDVRSVVLYIWQDLKYLYLLNDGIVEPDKTILKLFATMLNTFNWERRDTYSAYQAIEHVLYAEKDPNQKNLQSLLNIYQQTETLTQDRLPKLKWLFRRFLFSPEPKL